MALMSEERERVRILPDGRLRRRDAAKYLGVAEKTMAMWQLNGKGPRAIRVGGLIFYFKDDLDAFVRGEAA
jgi:hypothetical protein